MPTGIYKHNPRTNEVKKKISIANKGKNNGMYGKHSWNYGLHYKGKPHSEETKRKIGLANSIRKHKKTEGFQKGRIGNIGAKNCLWKGDKVSYSGIHHWVKRWKGKPSYCEMCGKIKKKYSWANKDHTYKRVIGDNRPSKSCQGGT